MISSVIRNIGITIISGIISTISVVCASDRAVVGCQVKPPPPRNAASVAAAAATLTAARSAAAAVKLSLLKVIA